MPEPGPIGPVREQTDDAADGFDSAVAPLARGELLMPPPFDFASAAALARNIDMGHTAEQLFDFDSSRPVHFHVRIHAISPDQPELGDREVVDTVAQGANPLLALLETLIEEIAAQQQ